MEYISTRNNGDKVSFRKTVMGGLARDGGLFLPSTIPDVSEKLDKWSSLSYQELALEIMKLYTDIEAETLNSLITRSYSAFCHPEITPVVQAGPLRVMELFHGPTLAFKDVALQFLGNLFEYYLGLDNRVLNIVAATSGDTGSAAIHGVKGKKGIRIFVMFPKGKVSPAQERQMTSVLDENVVNIAVEGTFDDCQNILKSIFGDLEFKDRYSLGSVNSINWARILAQIVYYFYGASRTMAETGAASVRFAVPTGNFGDIFAGFIARSMGLPIDKLILATNENDILKRFFQSGTYKSGQALPTISPSMDIQVASNFERYLYYRSGENSAVLKSLMKSFAETGAIQVEPLSSGIIDDLFIAESANTAETLDTIKKFHEKHGYLMDPHTAVGAYSGEKFVSDKIPVICLATAHPAKFSDAIRQATGKDLARHPAIDRLAGLPVRCETCANSAGAVREIIEEHC